MGELIVEIAGLRERIADKDSVITDLRHRLDVADRRLDEAAEDRRRVDELRIALADAVAARTDRRGRGRRVAGGGGGASQLEAAATLTLGAARAVRGHARARCNRPVMADPPAQCPAIS